MAYQVKDSIRFVAGLLLMWVALLILLGLAYISIAKGAYIFAIVMPILLLFAIPLCITLTVLGWGAIKDSMEQIE